MKRLFLFLNLVVSGIYSSGCEVVSPYVQNLNFISVPEEKQISTQFAGEISNTMKLVQGDSQTRVRQIGNKLVQSLPRKEFDYQFYVVDDATPNAFTIPGAKIYVHTGLLKFVSSDDELAGVLAHEIGHAYDRHPAKGMSRQLGVEYLSQLVLPKNKGAVKQIAVNLAKTGVLTRYGRDDEFEADELGFYILRKAGYRTDGLRSFLYKLQSLQSSGQSLSFMSTHPPTQDRVARLKAMESGTLTPRVETSLFKP